MIRVLVDVSYLAYRALHAIGDLEFEEIPTGVIFGFFHQLRQICLDEKIRSNRVLIFCDSRSSSKRAVVYPDYKKGRRAKRSEEEVKRVSSMRVQIDMLTSSVLPELGFPVYRQEGLESDDLIAWAARRISINARLRKDHSRQAVIVTADGDLYQCINPWVHWFDPQRKVYHNEESMLMTKGVTPAQWREVKMLAGCSSDNVKGVPGVGEKTAIQFLKKELPPNRKTHERICSGEGRVIAERNRGLVVLPHADTEPIELQEPHYDIKAFFRCCKKFGLLSILDDRRGWDSFFRGSFFRTHKRGEIHAR